jgi:hypothetical protein
MHGGMPFRTRAQTLCTQEDLCFGGRTQAREVTILALTDRRVPK